MASQPLHPGLLPNLILHLNLYSINSTPQSQRSPMKSFWQWCVHFSNVLGFESPQEATQMCDHSLSFQRLKSWHKHKTKLFTFPLHCLHQWNMATPAVGWITVNLPRGDSIHSIQSSVLLHASFWLCIGPKQVNIVVL